MMHSEKTNFSKKHSVDAMPNPSVEAEIKNSAPEAEISCAVAFEIAKKLNVPVKEIGVCIDLLNVRLIKCQLGLFGYKPKKKIVTPLDSVDQDLAGVVQGELIDGRLPCKVAWDIASRLGIKKMAVSRACESLKIKVKPCQLGAF